LSDDKYSSDFEATQQFLGTLVANQAVHRQAKRVTNEDRKVSGTNSAAGTKGSNKKQKPQPRIGNRYYSNAEWNKLTPEEKEQVKEIKKKAKEQGSGKAGKRKAAATTSSSEKDGDEPISEPEGESISEPLNQGGNEFGRGAHKKQKKASIAALASRAEQPTKASRHVLGVTTRRVMRMDVTPKDNFALGGRVELDTHADTCVAGTNTIVLDLTGKTVSVSPFCDSQYESIADVPIATVATVYDCPVTGKAHVLVLNEVLYLGDKMPNTLLCPNQLRANGIQVHDCPKQFDPQSKHAIYIPDADLQIPLQMWGVISGFHTRRPTQAELDDVTSHIELTSEEEWTPYATMFSTMEDQHDETWKDRRIQRPKPISIHSLRSRSMRQTILPNASLPRLGLSLPFLWQVLAILKWPRSYAVTLVRNSSRNMSLNDGMLDIKLHNGPCKSPPS
jgi:hypothetical protein